MTHEAKTLADRLADVLRGFDRNAVADAMSSIALSWGSSSNRAVGDWYRVSPSREQVAQVLHTGAIDKARAWEWTTWTVDNEGRRIEGHGAAASVDAARADADADLAGKGMVLL